MENINENISEEKNLAEILDNFKQEIIAIMTVNPLNKGNIDDVNLLVDNMAKEKVIEAKDIYELTDAIDLFNDWVREKEKIEKKLAKEVCFFQESKTKRLNALNKNFDILAGKVLDWVIRKIKDKSVQISGSDNAEWESQRMGVLERKLSEVRAFASYENIRSQISNMLESSEESGRELFLKDESNKIAFDLFIMGKINKEVLINEFLRGETGVLTKCEKLEVYFDKVEVKNED